MFMIFKKKTVLFAVLLAAIAIGALVTGSYNNKSVAVDTSAGGADTEDEYVPLGRAEMVASEVVEHNYFEQARAGRKSARDEALNLLNDTVNNTASSPEARSEASAKIAEIADRILKEAAAEDIIKSKGYADAVVYITDSEINVTVKAKELNETDISKIQDVIIAQTDNNNIKIVAVE